MMLFLGPIEEFGWRGVAQPLLQRHMAPIWAGLLIGATWGLWHMPATLVLARRNGRHRAGKECIGAPGQHR
jgi:membrane protease YdiL (CAAX protease family)